MKRRVLTCFLLLSAVLCYVTAGVHSPRDKRIQLVVPSLRSRADTSAFGVAVSRDRSGVAANRIDEDRRVQLEQSYAKLPLSFTANQGQTDPRVMFVSRGIGYTLFLAQDEAVLELQNPVVRTLTEGLKRGVKTGRSRGEQSNSRFLNSVNQTPSAILRMKLAGADLPAKMRALDELPGRTSYFIGNDPRKWTTNVPSYAKVKYEGIYPGIDLVYYGDQRQLEYDFVVAPGANPSRIRLAFQGHKRLRIDRHGDLIVSAETGEIRFQKPTVYQALLTSDRNSQIPSSRIPVDGRYVLTAAREVAFEVPAYDATKPLIIDPTLAYSTYLGGSGNENSITIPPSLLSGITVDSLGNVYVTGNTTSTDFPTMTPFQPHLNGAGTISAFVAKLTPDGSALVYSTYLGGTGSANYPTGIAVDSLGNAYVAGITNSANFPVKNAFQPTFQGVEDAFVTKFSADGTALVYSTFLSGSVNGFADAIAVDSGGSAYVVGSTESADFPTVNAFQPAIGALGSESAFLSKFKPDGSGLLYSTYLGGSTGSEIDGAFGVAVDSLGDAYVTGTAGASSFPTKNAAQPTPGRPPDGFVAKFDTTQSGAASLVFSTFLGGSGSDTPTAVALDSNLNVYVTGNTNSADFPTTPGSFQATCAAGCQAGFVTKYTMDGTLVYSTYLGAGASAAAYGIGVDANGDAYVAGSASHVLFPFKNPLPSIPANANLYIAALNPSGSGLVFSTPFGGSSNNFVSAMAVDSTGNAYITGGTSSVDFPVTSGAFQKSIGGGSDAFVAKISSAAPAVTLAPTPLTFGNQTVGTTSAAQGVSLTNSGNGPLVISAIAASGDFAETNTCGTLPATLLGTASCSISVTFTPTAAGSRTGDVTITDDAGSGSQQVPLSGNGVPGAVTLLPSPVNFNNQVLNTTSAAMQVTLSNSSGVLLSAITVGIIGANPGDFAQTNTCGTTLPNGGSCAIDVTFRPASIGARAATLQVSDSDPSSPQQASLTGTGTGVPTAVASPTSLSFNNQNAGTTSAIQNVQVQNTGTASLTITGVTASDAADFQVVAPGAGATPSCVASNSVSIPPNTNCFFAVQFTPRSLGPLSSTIRIADNAANSPQQVSASGTGTGTPTANISPTTLTFPGEIVGTTSGPQAVTLSNKGNALLTISSTAHSGDFAESDSCGGTVAVGATCALNITFTPTANGPRTGSITVTDNAAASPQSVALTGTGLDFSVSSQTSSQTVSAGLSATYTIAATALGGAFNNAVAFTASGAPAGSTVTFNPTPVTPGATSATTTMTVTLTAGVAETIPLTLPSPERPLELFTSITITLLFAFLISFHGSNRPRYLVSACLFLIAAVGLVGCNGGFPAANTIPSAQNFTITVIGTSGALQHSTTVLLTVK
jgi:hypothetical protein